MQPKGVELLLTSMKSLLFPALAALLLAGCAPTIAPHVPYLPLLRHKGQAEARATLGLLGKKAEFQLGYQATDRLVLHTALFKYGALTNGEGFRSAELGAGYYRPIANDRWRLGLHAGLATGRGASGERFCHGCDGPNPSYSVGYTYAYLQPTALLQAKKLTVGLGLRLAQARYHRLTESQVVFSGSQPPPVSYASHYSAFAQPVAQLSYRVLPWLALSGAGGLQFFLGRYHRFDSVDPVVGQVGLHVLLGPRPGQP